MQPLVLVENSGQALSVQWMFLTVVRGRIGVECRVEIVAVDGGTVVVTTFGKKADDFQFQIDVAIVEPVEGNTISDPFVDRCQSLLDN